ncbi:hypothetical protein [Streptomyces sp. NPDC054854]
MPRGISRPGAQLHQLGEQPNDLIMAAVDLLVECFNAALNPVCLLLQPGKVATNRG